MKERYRKEVTGRRRRRRKQLLDDPRKTKDSGNCKRKYQIALFGELALEGRIQNERMNERTNERTNG
jgi:hypothetical protein